MNFNYIKKVSRDFIKNEDGMTTVEYVLLAVFIFLAVVAVVRILGKTMGKKFNQVDSELNKK